MYERLRRVEAPYQIGIIGIGSIGTGLFYQASITPGIECVAIADLIVDRAVKAAEWLQRNYLIVNSVAEMHDAIRRGMLAVAGDGLLVAECEGLDLVIEASNGIEAAGQHAIAAVERQSHVVMMNYEADVAFGPYLMALARRYDVVYSGADGDQPAVIKRIIDDLNLWGFDLVMAGNIKGYLDRYANPTSIIPEAKKRNLDPKMCASYTDGSKLNIEMASLANAIGLRTILPGMTGPRIADIHQVFDCFDFKKIWQDRSPVTDYVLGAQPSGGVFAIGYTDSDFQQFTLEWYPPDMGPGPFYLFYRPYHLGHIEAMQGVAEALLDGRAHIQPEHGFQTNVYAYAKRDLCRGETLDGIGGYSCYGLIENCVDNLEQPGLPIVLADNVKVQRDIPRNDKILMVDVDYDLRRPLFSLYEKAVQAGFGTSI